MHYLDHAATTTVRPEAAQAYAAALRVTGNASSVHAAGRQARRALEEARERIAGLLGAAPAEVVLTSGGTEADALAVMGGARAGRTRGRDRVVVSAVEHHAVLDSALALGREGFDVRRLPVDRDGRVRLDALEAVDPSTAVVSVMWAGNETGVVQPLPEVVDAAHRSGALAHTDAVQAVGHVPVDFHGSGVDLLSLSGHKIGAPAGTGALLVRRDVTIEPLHHGGGQERGLRPGTVDVPGAVALATALESAVQALPSETPRLRGLRDRLACGLATLDGVHESGATLAEEQRLPHIVHAVVEGADADSLVFALDRAGIAVSAGAACRAGVQEPSHVIVAMGIGQEHARSGLRCSLGWDSTDADVDAFVHSIGDAVERARRARGR